MLQRLVSKDIPVGIGYYTVPEAARLIRVPSLSIRRWLSGYTYATRDGERRTVPPLWTPQIPAFEKQIELGFRDLIELRFVAAFLDAGLGIQTIRRCLDHARAHVDDERPFSTRRFRTDGKTIFFEFAERAISAESDTSDLPREDRQTLIDLKNRQFAFRDVIAQTFKDLDLDDDVVARWRPFRGKDTIVIDPQRAFGQPIATSSGVPTARLASALKAEGYAQRVALLYDVPVRVVRDAEKFENELAAA